MAESCLFCKIIAKEIPAKIAFEDEEILVFHDIAPKAKVHLLMILKEHFADLQHMSQAQGSKLSKALNKIDSIKDKLGLSGGYRLIINQGKDGGQTVFHLHVHILGGQALEWNPS